MAQDPKQALQLMSMVAGIAIGLQILVKALDKVHDFSHHPVKIGFLFLAAAFVLVGSFLHHKLEKKIKNIHALFHLAEGSALAATAFILFEKGKMRMPLVLLFVGLLFAVVGVAGYFVTPQNRDRVGRRLLRGIGLAFLAAGPVTLLLNHLYGRDAWVYGIGGLFLGLGLLFSFGADRIVARIGRTDPGH